MAATSLRDSNGAHALRMYNLRGGQVTSEMAALLGLCAALHHQRMIV
jgi:hypothetical protein